MAYTLYTDSTPNPFKVHILLEELGVEYTSRHVDFSENEQKTPEFRAINANGKVPVLIDHDLGDLAIAESGAILIHLAERHGKFLPTEPRARAQVMQWLMWQMAGLGPIFGNLMVFAGPFQNAQPQATARFDAELRRLFDVLDGQLEDHEFVAGDHSIADIACIGWMWPVKRIGWDLGDWPNVKVWHDRLMARPAYQRGFAAPGDKPDDKRIKGFVQAVVGLPDPA